MTSRGFVMTSRGFVMTSECEEGEEANSDRSLCGESYVWYSELYKLYPHVQRDDSCVKIPNNGY